MNTIVFTGPTLPPDEARELFEADYRPPVSEGDVFRAVQDAPQAIGIIDGFFENVPSVWHKEVLYAMSKGIWVYGSASMGALRAAELSAFGMIGVGATFEAFRDLILEDDDEVAVIHGPRELGYPALSEAMVNIRRTLSDAYAEGTISAAARQALESLAKELPYRRRSFQAVLSIASKLDVDPEELARLEAWLPRGRVDQKREDAIMMLRAMREQQKPETEALAPTFHFEHTTLWEKAARLAAQPATAV